MLWLGCDAAAGIPQPVRTRAAAGAAPLAVNGPDQQ
jgi:hypothetical protein